jgi:hypothetical protein
MLRVIAVLLGNVKLTRTQGSTLFGKTLKNNLPKDVASSRSVIIEVVRVNVAHG